MKCRSRQAESGFALIILGLVVTVGAGLYSLGTHAMQHKARLDETFSQCEQIMENDNQETGDKDPFGDYQRECYEAVKQLGSEGAQVALDAIMAPVEGADLGMNAVQALDDAFSGHEDLKQTLQKVKQEASNPQPDMDNPPAAAAGDDTSAGTSDTAAQEPPPVVDGHGFCSIAGGKAEVSAHRDGYTIYASLRISDETRAEQVYNNWQDFYYPKWYLDNLGKGKYFGTKGTVNVEAACEGKGVEDREKRYVGYLGVVSGTQGLYSWGVSGEWSIAGSPESVYVVTFYVKGSEVASVKCR